MDSRDRSVGAVQDELDALTFFLPESDADTGRLPPLSIGSAAELSSKQDRSGSAIELTGGAVVIAAAYRRYYPGVTPGRRRRHPVRLHTIGALTIEILTTIAIRAVSLGRGLLSAVRRAGRYTRDRVARTRARAFVINRSFVGGVLVGALAVQLFGIRYPADSAPAPELPSTSSRPVTPSPPAAVATTLIQESTEADKAPPARPSSAIGPSAPRAASMYRGGLRIDSQPAGATVFINNQRVGHTPIALPSLPVGSRAVRLELNGYAPWSRSVRIAANQSATVSARLLPKPPAPAP